MIAQELEVSLHMAFMEARQKRHELISVEHLLLAMLDNPSAAEVLRSCGANIDQLRKQLTEFTDEHTPVVPGSEDVETQPTLGFQRVIQRAILHVQSSGKKEVTGANILVAIFGEKDSHAVYFLHQQNISRLDVVNFISHGITKDSGNNKKSEPPPGRPAPSSQNENSENEQEAEASSAGGALENYTQNLNQMAQAGKIDRLRIRDAIAADFLRPAEHGIRKRLVRRATVPHVVLDTEVVVRPARIVAGRKDDPAERLTLAYHRAGRGGG